MTQELMQRLGIQSPETAGKGGTVSAGAGRKKQTADRKKCGTGKRKNTGEEALQNAKKIAAMEKAILEAGGKNAKAILALIDADEVTMNEKGNWKGWIWKR